MKKLFLLSICLVLLETLSAQTGKIRVATVGNSLTGATNDYGFYGMALGEMLGDEYEVTKFGKGASGIFIKLREDGTTEENPNEYKFAYINSEECAAALAYNPDIVVIKFGANDANKKLFETYGKETFKDDYKKLINKFRALPTHPDVYICLTPPMFYGEGGFLGSFDDAASTEYIHTSVKEIAQELNLTYVDLYTPLKDHPEYMPGGMDWVHPDHRGHYIIAREVFKAIKGSFIMNPGGIRTEATQIDLSGSKAKLKSQAIVNSKDGQKISFNAHFGDIPTYEKIEVETQLNKAKSGTFDFYLDNEPAAFASIDISGANTKEYSVQSALFNRKIKGNHTVTVRWNGHNANLRSVTIKEQHMPFVNEDDTKQYYIVNKATGFVLDCDTATKTIRAFARIPGKASQLFTVEHFTYHTFRIRNIETDLHIQNRQETVIVGKPGDNWRVDDPKYSLFIQPTGDGSFTIQLSGSEAIGISFFENKKVTGNKNVTGQTISDLDKWEFIEAGL